jgi:uncharacterized protein
VFKLLSPTHRLNRTLEITPEWMRTHQLEGLLIDIDNTLVPFSFEGDLPETLEWARMMRAANIPMRIISNAAPDRVERWSAKLEILAVGMIGRGTGGKPLPGAFRKAVAELGLEASRVAMVGDQVFTDVLGGNWAGCKTILVKPLSDNALPHTKLVRNLEARVLGEKK